MKFAYADPPYPGCGHRYAEKNEVDHVALIERLVSEYPDGWALSTSSTALQGLLAMCPAGVRVGSWVKPFAVFKPNVNPAYAWEPVIFSGGRRGDRKRATIRDWHSANITLKKGMVGVKPASFNEWIIDLLGAIGGDEFHDLYPDLGGFGKAWDVRAAEGA